MSSADQIENSEENTGTETDWYSPEIATFGDRLAAARHHAGLRQSELAKKLGVKKATLAAWEQDTNEPRANKLQMLSGMLGVSIRWLLTGIGTEGKLLEESETQTLENQALLVEVRELRAHMLAAAERLARLEKRLRLNDE